MSHKSILVHLANDEEHTRRLDVALRFAKENDAHVTALFVTTPIGMPAEVYGRGASVQFLIEATQAAEKRAEELEQEFRNTCKKKGIEHSWVVQEGDHLSLLADHAHAADVIIVSQPTFDHFEDRFRIRLAEEITLLSGLPTFLIPRGYDTTKSIGKRIMVAWKGTREALRAVRDSLPVLKEAEKVYLLSVQATTKDALSLTEVENFLERHDVNAETVKIPQSDTSVGETIHATALSHNCDLIVCGAYGHSRLREMFLGGVTRHLVANTTLPVMMSH